LLIRIYLHLGAVNKVHADGSPSAAACCAYSFANGDLTNLKAGITCSELHIQVCKEHGALLIVDEAHGAHLGQHPLLPPSAMQCGAHISIQSSHKTIGALTQAAMLHVAHNVTPSLQAAVGNYLRMLQTSSPSYLLMASLEAAAHGMGTPGVLDEALQAAELLRQGLKRAGLQAFGGPATGKNLDALRGSPCATPRKTKSELGSSRCSGGASDCMSRPEISAGAVTYVDPLRITCLASWGLTGHTMARMLEEAGVVVELATESCIVFALGSGSTVGDAVAVLEAISALPLHTDRHVIQPAPAMQMESTGGARPLESKFGGFMSLVEGHTVVDMAAVLQRPLKQVPWQQATGCFAGVAVSVYPPGIPTLLPGELISSEKIDGLRGAVDSGAMLVGCSDNLSDLTVCA
jgi:arginine decarboxylase